MKSKWEVIAEMQELLHDIQDLMVKDDFHHLNAEKVEAGFDALYCCCDTARKQGIECPIHGKERAEGCPDCKIEKDAYKTYKILCPKHAGKPPAMGEGEIADIIRGFIDLEKGVITIFNAEAQYSTKDIAHAIAERFSKIERGGYGNVYRTNLWGNFEKRYTKKCYRLSKVYDWRNRRKAFGFRSSRRKM